MKHIKIEKNQDLIITLHGTGGDRNDLIPIAKYIDDQATIIGLEGDVVENGMLRFFKRFTHNNFDLDSLEAAKDKFINFLKPLYNQYKTITLVGYSNGANLILYTLKSEKLLVDNVLLFHPTNMLEDKAFIDQKLNVFVSYGDNDPYITKKQYESLIKDLEKTSYNLKVLHHKFGHQLIQEELEVAKKHILKASS